MYNSSGRLSAPANQIHSRPGVTIAKVKETLDRNLANPNWRVVYCRMKVLIDHPLPFALAHGGLQVQIEHTKRGLEQAGVEVEYLRWWDEDQKGDVIHYVGRPSSDLIRFAHQKGMRVVLAELLSGLGSRPPTARLLQKCFMRMAETLLPSNFTSRMAWESYRTADACIALTEFEARLMQDMFGAPSEKVHVLPNGIEEIFFTKKGETSKWLICTASITERKRVLETAQAAAIAGTPLWVIGKPYSEKDGYFREFRDLCARHSGILRYDGPVNDRAQLAEAYRCARGFVLLSTMETRSISAEEAAASATPLLLSDLSWARSVFGDKVQYCSPRLSGEPLARALRSFYDLAPSLPPPPLPCSWTDVGHRLCSIYKSAGA